MNAVPPLIAVCHLHDLGDGFTLRRMLPARDTRRVGPFVFFEHIGPTQLDPGEAVEVRPHPHIGRPR